MSNLSKKDGIRRWSDLYPKSEIKEPNEIDAHVAATFNTPSGQIVLNWLVETLFLKVLPTGSSTSAWEENEGKKKLVLDLVNRIEDNKRDNERRKSKPNTRR